MKANQTVKNELQKIKHRPQFALASIFGFYFDIKSIFSSDHCQQLQITVNILEHLVEWLLLQTHDCIVAGSS